MIASHDVTNTQLEFVVNERFGNVEPGFIQVDSAPVLFTPVVAAAGAAFVLGSGICLGC